MKTVTLLLLLVFVSSCGTKQDKASQSEESTKKEYLQKGQEIVKLSQAELLKNVSSAMKTGGPAYAVEFCNVRAITIKDSLSDLYNCEIRRIADQYRNPIDMPKTETEKMLLEKYMHAFHQGDTLKPVVYISGERVEYYQPILLKNAGCLLCHGTPGEQISEETLTLLNAKYPDDLATGYALNDFRGAWKITFSRTEE